MSTASQASVSSRPSSLPLDIPQRRKPEHPKGFYSLCAVELFERFAGTLLGSLLLLYLSERLGMTTGSATRLSGTFNAAIYLSSVIGGVIADRWLGTRRAMLLGTLLLALGYAVLSMDSATLLYPSVGLLMLGHALFKPSITRWLVSNDRYCADSPTVPRPVLGPKGRGRIRPHSSLRRTYGYVSVVAAGVSTIRSRSFFARLRGITPTRS
jgi:hypothetical protein